VHWQGLRGIVWPRYVCISWNSVGSQRTVNHRRVSIKSRHVDHSRVRGRNRVRSPQRGLGAPRSPLSPVSNKSIQIDRECAIRSESHYPRDRRYLIVWKSATVWKRGRISLCVARLTRTSVHLLLLFFLATVSSIWMHECSKKSRSEVSDFANKYMNAWYLRRYIYSEVISFNLISSTIN